MRHEKYQRIIGIILINIHIVINIILIVKFPVIVILKLRISSVYLFYLDIVVFFVSVLHLIVDFKFC